jgi:hypothetical protein
MLFTAEPSSWLERQARDLRARAAQLRAAAHAGRGSPGRDTLLTMAAEADRLATTREAQARGLVR